ncbi:P-loop containing nucleoside triphosphate hydrolase protein [Suillus subluteus]|nr:P-loop containing nucleoside triphosphate hydrolase protein [Suillus subluteus]
MAQIRKLVELPLCHPQLFKSIGIKPPCGILMFGPPGTGKTLMARVVANETGAFFFLINSPEIMSKMAGESESNLWKAFEEAEKNLPAIIFIDEIDFITPKRDKEMDSTNAKKNVFIIGATNRPDQINSTLLRPGRLDQLIYIPLPAEVSRLAILKAALKKSPISQEVDLAFLAKQTHGFSGADLTEICQHAAKLAIHESIEFDIRRQRELKEKEDTEDAKMEVPSHR